MPETTLSVQTFFPVALAMIEPGTVLPCEVWLRHDDDHEPVLYRSRNLPFTAENRDRLIASGVETIWIPFGDGKNWTSYVEQRLHDRVTDESIPVEARAEILISSSRSIMKDILADPRAPGTEKRVGNLADAICDLMRMPSAVAAAVRLMEHDYYTYTHCLHVAVYSVALARAARIDADDVLAEIGRGALMHDCGKCKLPSSLINKPGRYSQGEWEQMKNHPEYGLQILVETDWKNSLVHEVVHAHHERMDGSGYPRGLVGKATHEAARITAICDAFDAMTTDRPYQRARKGLQALRILRFDEKDRYDQQLTELFIRVLVNPG